MAVESTYVAVDLGAESGRTVLGHFDGQRMAPEEVHRFSKTPVRLANGLHWDALRIVQEVKNGLASAVRNGGRIESLGSTPGGWTSGSWTGTVP